MQKINFHNGTAPALNATNLNLMQEYIEEAIEEGGGGGGVSGDTLPVGSIVAYSSTTIPTNWLLCDGRAISRTEYALLFSIIGTTYGVGDGSTTFNLPNLKGRVPVGVDSSQTEFDTLGETGGEKTHTLTISEMPKHDHTISHVAVGSNAPGYNNWEENIASGTGATYKASAKTNTTGGGQAHNILQPYQTTNYIIKAFQSAGVVAKVVNQYSTSQTNTYSADYVNNLNAYSTTEKRIGTYMNKPLYRKVVELGNLPDGTTQTVKTVPHGLTNFKIIKVEGTAWRNDNAVQYPLPFVWHSNDQIEFLVSDTNITLYTTGNKSDFTGQMILEYIKTTD